MNNLIITGASGLLGQYLCNFFADKYKVTGIYNSSIPDFSHSNITLLKMDLTESASLKTLIQNKVPQFLIHTAGYTSVDECQTHPQVAYEQNVTCTKNVCDALAGLDTKLIQISTDHLFSGKEANYSEDAMVEPLNVYAQTKLLAETETLKFSNSVIVRTNFYGGHTDKKMSFSSWIFNELNKGKKINMFDDVFFTPISICALAKNLDLIMNSKLKGVYNIVGDERLSKYDFALKLAHFFNLSTELISKTTVENLHLKAKRPRDMSLSVSKIKRDLADFKSENINEGLEKIKELNLI